MCACYSYSLYVQHRLCTSLKVALVVCVSHACDVGAHDEQSGGGLDGAGGSCFPAELLPYPDYDVTITWSDSQFHMDDPYTRNGDEYAWFTAINL
jgi:hypothetical protein